MAFFQEFKSFVNRGNAVDLAVGIIIGAAFGKVVSTLVSDVLMPPIGLLIGGVDFSALSIPVKAATDGHPEVTIKYGIFIEAIIDFLIITFTVFMVIKAFNRLRGGPQPKELETKKCPECYMAIPELAKRCGYCGTPLSESPTQQ